MPRAESRVEQIIYGPPVSADVEVRLSGPDPDVLRALADEAEAILRNETALPQTERSDLRERELLMRSLYATDRAQTLGITRCDMATALELATEGVQVGTLRELDRKIPIVTRTLREEVATDAPVLDQVI